MAAFMIDESICSLQTFHFPYKRLLLKNVPQKFILSSPSSLFLTPIILILRPCHHQADSRVYSVLDRLTPEALRATLAVEAPVEPVYLAPGTSNKDMPWSTLDLSTTPLPSPAAAAFRNHRHSPASDSPTASSTSSTSSSLAGATSNGYSPNTNWSGNPGADALGAGLLSALSHELLLDPSGFRYLDRHAALSLAAQTAGPSVESGSSGTSGIGNSLDLGENKEGTAIRLTRGVKGRRPSPLAQVARPLHLSTAQQVGLLDSDSDNGRVPSLASQLLPSGGASNKASERLLRRWLLQPPPPALADARATVLRLLDPSSCRSGSRGDSGAASSLHRDQDENGQDSSKEVNNNNNYDVASAPLPPFRSTGGVPLGKLVSMLAVAQGNPALFRDLALMLHAVLTLLGAPPLPEALHVWTPGAADAAAAVAAAKTVHGEGEGKGICSSDAGVKFMASGWLKQAIESTTDGSCHAGPLELLVDPMLLITAHESGLPVCSSPYILILFLKLITVSRLSYFHEFPACFLIECVLSFKVRREVFLRGAAQLLADLATTVAPPSPIDMARPSSVSSSSLLSTTNDIFDEEADDEESVDSEDNSASSSSSTMSSTGSGGKKNDGVSFHQSVPLEFFVKNEETWRGCVRATNSSNSNPSDADASSGSSNSVVAAAYEAVTHAAHALGNAARADFPPGGAEVYFDALNNQLLLRKIPNHQQSPASSDDEPPPSFYNPRDRTGKVRMSSSRYP